MRESAVTDDWLGEYPPRIEWWPNSVMPMEIPASEPIVETTQTASADVRRPGRLVHTCSPKIAR